MIRYSVIKEKRFQFGKFILYILFKNAAVSLFKVLVLEINHWMNMKPNHIIRWKLYLTGACRGVVEISSLSRFTL